MPLSATENLHSRSPLTASTCTSRSESTQNLSAFDSRFWSSWRNCAGCASIAWQSPQVTTPFFSVMVSESSSTASWKAARNPPRPARAAPSKRASTRAGPRSASASARCRRRARSKLCAPFVELFSVHLRHGACEPGHDPQRLAEVVRGVVGELLQLEVGAFELVGSALQLVVDLRQPVLSLPALGDVLNRSLILRGLLSWSRLPFSPCASITRRSPSVHWIAHSYRKSEPLSREWSRMPRTRSRSSGATCSR